ncbi:MAG: hypothetical protein ACR2QB_05785, partial [Gammaproteobacteria bacterium]
GGESMNRRDFVTRFSGTLAASGAAAASVAVSSRDTAGNLAQEGMEFLGREIKALNKRVDNIDESHKRMFRALVVVASVSTGMDVLNLLKGDVWS